MVNDIESLLAPDQVAEMLQLKPQTLAVWRCTKRQQLPFVKLGGRVRYRQLDVADFIRSNRQVA